MVGKFVIDEDEIGKYRFRLTNSHGKVLLSSWGYLSIRACKQGIESARRHSKSRIRLVRQQTPIGTHRFRLVSSRGSALAQSPIYDTETEYTMALAEVRESAPVASVIDKTSKKNRSQAREPRNDLTEKVYRPYMQYRIYAAPLHTDRTPDNEDSEYGPHISKMFFIDGFINEQERDAFWEGVIESSSAETKYKADGSRYEIRYRRCNLPPDGKWKWVGCLDTQTPNCCRETSTRS